MGAHVLWKVNIKFTCMLAKIGPHTQSVLTKARTNFCLWAWVPCWARQQEPYACDPHP